MARVRYGLEFRDRCKPNECACAIQGVTVGAGIITGVTNVNTNSGDGSGSQMDVCDVHGSDQSSSSSSTSSDQLVHRASNCAQCYSSTNTVHARTTGVLRTHGILASNGVSSLMRKSI